MPPPTLPNNVQLLIHVAAPSTAVADTAYAVMADSMLAFEPVGPPIRVSELPEAEGDAGCGSRIASGYGSEGRELAGETEKRTTDRWGNVVVEEAKGGGAAGVETGAERDRGDDSCSGRKGDRGQSELRCMPGISLSEFESYEELEPVPARFPMSAAAPAATSLPEIPTLPSSEIATSFETPPGVVPDSQPTKLSLRSSGSWSVEVDHSPAFGVAKAGYREDRGIERGSQEEVENLGLSSGSWSSQSESEGRKSPPVASAVISMHQTSQKRRQEQEDQDHAKPNDNEPASENMQYQEKSTPAPDKVAYWGPVRDNGPATAVAAGAPLPAATSLHPPASMAINTTTTSLLTPANYQAPAQLHQSDRDHGPPHLQTRRRLPFPLCHQLPLEIVPPAPTPPEYPDPDPNIDPGSDLPPFPSRSSVNYSRSRAARLLQNPNKSVTTTTATDTTSHPHSHSNPYANYPPTFTTHVTPTLALLATRLPLARFFEPAVARQTRALARTERGCWCWRVGLVVDDGDSAENGSGGGNGAGGKGREEREGNGGKDGESDEAWKEKKKRKSLGRNGSKDRSYNTGGEAVGGYPKGKGNGNDRDREKEDEDEELGTYPAHPPSTLMPNPTPPNPYLHPTRGNNQQSNSRTKGQDQNKNQSPTSHHRISKVGKASVARTAPAIRTASTARSARNVYCPSCFAGVWDFLVRFVGQEARAGWGVWTVLEEGGEEEVVVRVAKEGMGKEEGIGKRMGTGREREKGEEERREGGRGGTRIGGIRVPGSSSIGGARSTISGTADRETRTRTGFDSDTTKPSTSPAPSPSPSPSPSSSPPPQTQTQTQNLNHTTTTTTITTITPLTLKLYGWAETMPHLYLLLYLATDGRLRLPGVGQGRQMGKAVEKGNGNATEKGNDGDGPVWRDGKGESVVFMW